MSEQSDYDATYVSSHPIRSRLHATAGLVLLLFVMAVSWMTRRDLLDKAEEP